MMRRHQQHVQSNVSVDSIVQSSVQSMYSVAQSNVSVDSSWGSQNCVLCGYTHMATMEQYSRCYKVSLRGNLR
jgi:hypothetical protein